jgi:uncharacterized protein YPO0396
MVSEDQSGDLFALENSPRDSPFVLHQLEVFNWGPFAGMHRAEIDPRGTAVIGPTGSGKTTLIDALMTLLVLQPRYNLASTGGHESDRTLISYVRGVLGGDSSIAGGDYVARPGKVYTGVCGTYCNGGETLKLAAVLWTEGTSNAAQDLKRRWIFSMAEGESLEIWLRLVNDDGARHLMRHGRETAQLRVFESKKAYLAHVRRFFDVGENAFTLLNRAAGLKQLNSIDEIFRELVLDDRSAFERALEVAGEFDNLAEIHAELETARRQQESLAPIGRESKKLERIREREESLAALKRILPVWFAITGERLWTEVAQRLSDEREALTAGLGVEEQRHRECESRVETLRECYLKLGGNVIGELENTIEEIEARVAERRKHAEDYQRVATNFGLDPKLDETTLAKNKHQLAQRREALEKSSGEKDGETLEARSRLRDVMERLETSEAALRKVKERPGSNIPPSYQDFRSALAERLAIDEDTLPFAAEMVEVKAEESAWRGAIERAIGGERLRLLVPESQIDLALRWVNDRDNRLHVRLLRAGAGSQLPKFFADGFMRKLSFKPHPLREAMKELLARYDRHCVDSPDALRQIDHGMTIAGLMSGRRGRFEKQDQRPLDVGWMTGFDNRDQMRALERERATLGEQKTLWDETTTRLQRELRELNIQSTMIDQLCALDFATIDLPGAESDLAASRQRLKSLLEPDSDASRAKEPFDQAKADLKEVADRIREIEKEIAVLQREQERAEIERKADARRAGEGLSEQESELAAKQIVISAEITAEDLRESEREQRERVEAKLEYAQKEVATVEQALVRKMEAAKRVDTGALAETGSELADVPDYLERLRVLEVESLPEKLDRFREYLNRSSDQGVTQLLAGIAEEVDAIEYRISELNRTLAKVEFQAGYHLRLVPGRIRHERLRTLEAAQRHLRNAALREDAGESHFQALRRVIEILRDAGENRRQLGSRALLDPRHRLQFSVVIVNVETGNTSAPRSGSQSGSGGEKELMASHILTAALSYALCPTEGTRPLYGTVVLDEAFSKSSPSAAGRIIEALRVFGLHPIFVTPNKEIGLLRRHTHRVVCVQRSGKQASIATISWDKLDEIAIQSRSGSP